MTDDLMKLVHEAGFRPRWPETIQKFERLIELAAEHERLRLHKKLTTLPINDTAHSIGIWIKDQK